ncbi:DUF2238 domain-containing protein [Mesobacillus harenae]|uniref:DUF2238 domain-containing protein n=1 Tax=Mesobacillus harenae TaxID=2213203 RepID=UPI001580E78E|nr:DUF2238 domain-containing protein [Mesobacillus harenae]
MNKNSTKTHLILFSLALAVLIWSAINTSGYRIWLLESAPGIILLLITFITYKRFRFTTLSYGIIVLSAIIMFIGAKYTYSEVPLFNWLKDTYDFIDRNHYDRFGHFLKGLFAIVIREIIIRQTSVKKGPWLYSITISFVLSIAALYEIIEWLVSKLTNDGEAAKDFLGTQGDIWDTHWDMFLALLGTLVALLLLSRLHDRLLKKHH